MDFGRIPRWTNGRGLKRNPTRPTTTKKPTQKKKKEKKTPTQNTQKKKQKKQKKHTTTPIPSRGRSTSFAVPRMSVERSPQGSLQDGRKMKRKKNKKNAKMKAKAIPHGAPLAQMGHHMGVQS